MHAITMTDLTKAQQLLAHALRDPFPKRGQANHVQKWVDFLVENWPLWSFQRERYVELEGASWFSTEALRQIVRTLRRDDGVAKPKKLTPLETELDHRRYRLARVLLPNVAIPAWSLADDELRSGPCLFCRLHFPGLKPEGGYADEYERVGLQFMLHVAKVRNSAKGERMRAERQLLRFARALAKQGRRGRRLEGPSEELLKALVAEGREIIEVCWRLMRLLWSIEVQQFAQLGLSPAATRSWSARLALPLLSRREIAVMCAEIKRASTWPTHKSGRPTPRLFAIWVLSRRLNLGAKSVARKALGGAASAYFASPNPIDRQPHP